MSLPQKPSPEAWLNNTCRILRTKLANAELGLTFHDFGEVESQIRKAIGEGLYETKTLMAVGELRSVGDIVKAMDAVASRVHEEMLAITPKERERRATYQGENLTEWTEERGLVLLEKLKEAAKEAYTAAEPSAAEKLAASKRGDAQLGKA
jgi:hypothetical protein